MNYKSFSTEKLLLIAQKTSSEIEMLERALECVPESSILGYMSISSSVAYRKKKLQSIEMELDSRK